MTLTEARARVCASIAHGMDQTSDAYSSYGPANIDRAIQFAGNDFAEATRAIRGTTDVTVPVGSAVVDFTATAALAKFLEFSFIWAHIAGAPVKLAPLHAVQRELTLVAATGTPTRIAFEGPTRAWLNKVRSAQLTLTVFWWQPFTSWTAGTTPGSAADAITLNLPDRYADAVLQMGAATKLVFNNPDELNAQAGWLNYVEARNRIAAEFQPPHFPPSEDASRNAPTRRTAAAA